MAQIYNGILLGLFLALFNGILGYSAVKWALLKSDSVFYGVFFAGMLWKLVVLGALTVFLWNHASVHTPSALISLGLATFLFNLSFLRPHGF